MEQQIKDNLKANSRRDYTELISKLYRKDYEDLNEYKIGKYGYFMTDSLERSNDHGLTNDFVKGFPVGDLLKEKDLVDSIELVTNLYLSTAYSMSQDRKEAVINLMEIKINTLKALNIQAKAVKVSGVSVTVTCGSIGDDYVSLANRSEEIDLNDFVGFENDDLVEIGIELIRNGLKYKKEYKGKWLELKTSTDKVVSIYFANSNDDNAGSYLTHERVAIVTGKATAYFLEDKNDMPALGLNLGWHALTDDTFLNKLNTFFAAKNWGMVEKHEIFMICIPKLKPHKLLDISKATAHLFMAFHCLNDAYNTSKRIDHKIEAIFTADMYYKLTNLGIEIDSGSFKDLMTLLIPECLKNMRHRGTVSKDY